MNIYFEIYNVDKEKMCYLLFEQENEYINNSDENFVEKIKNILILNLDMEILDNELIYLGNYEDGTLFFCLQTFLRRKHIINLKKLIKNIKDKNIKITYFRNKKKINKLFLYDMKLYSLYYKLMIYERIKYELKDLF